MAVNDPASELHRLENRLVLHGWMCRMLGYASTRELLEDHKGVDEGFDSDGWSGVHRRLRSRTGKLRMPLSTLEGYDENIRRHVAQVNARRAEPVVLKYFQHIAALFTEILLDNRFTRPEEFTDSLNEYAANLDGETMRFGEGDLDRCAFWMATGSGKTLLMHINYRQFLHYNEGAGGGAIDNILLITPNRDLTEQHLEDMRLSGMPCERFEPEGALSFGRADVVRATEITKIKENLESDKGVSVDVDSFEGRNLVFVDEGHKGASGSPGNKEGAYLRRRRILAEGGYTFEYSATFGQALAKGTRRDKDDLITGYGKSILFDYSYRYFYGDGYGKDFRLLNLKDSGEENTDTLLAGNLLSFYEQWLCYDELGEEAGEYNLKEPLWILIGSKVDGNTERRSDVYGVLSFLHRFIRNRDGWAEAMIEASLDDEGIFADYFPHLKERFDGDGSFREIHCGILRRVFRSGGGGGLVVQEIRGADGQMGLGVSGSEDGYFGLVYVGDRKKLRELVEEWDEGISVEDDIITSGLFGGIEDEGSPVNVLVGARKFVEGWSSWRVSSMGLINVGSGEGPMIIQLFGRGVRLQGRNFSLKRSGATDGEHPESVAPVETLGVFGLKANYMSKFREALAREDVDPDGYITLPPLPIKEERAFLEEGLLVPRPPDEEFAECKNILLVHEENITVALDLSTRFETGGMAARGNGNFVSRAARSGAAEREIADEYLGLLDWNGIHHELLEFKAAKGYRNLVIPPGVPEALMRRGFYKLTCEESVAKPGRFEDLARLRDVAASLLGKYVEKFYHHHQQRWDTERMSVEPLRRDHGNLAFSDYKVMVKRNREDLIESVENLISRADEVYEAGAKELPNVYFDRHLYQPLLLEGDEAVKSTPVGLKESEKVFVDNLRRHCESGLKEGHKVFLLRNLSRGKGIGFFRTAGFYPDFIVWCKEGEKQRVVFVEPHGMRNDTAPDHNDKIRLYRDLEELSKRPGYENVELDSFMVSATTFDDLKYQWGGTWERRDFAKLHILFEDDLEERMPLILYGAKKSIPAP